MARKLKAALAKYQASTELAEKNAKRANHAEKIKIEQKAAKAARTRAAQSARSPWLPFEDSVDDLVLLIGEGDFSFALNLADKFPNIGIVATSLDTHDEVLAKYGDAASNTLNGLRDLHVPVAHGIDGTELAENKDLESLLEAEARPNLIVAFNFPHLGNSVSDQDRNIRQHQQLLLSFFKQARALGAAKVVVTLFDGEPYESWQAKQLARSAGLQLSRSGRFPWDIFGGYAHQLTGKGGGHTSKAQKQRDARIYSWVPTKPEHKQ